MFLLNPFLSYYLFFLFQLHSEVVATKRHIQQLEGHMVLVRSAQDLHKKDCELAVSTRDEALRVKQKLEEETKEMIAKHKQSVRRDGEVFMHESAEN